MDDLRTIPAADRAVTAADNAGELSEAEKLRADLEERHGKLIARKAELLAAGARVPDVIEDEETASRAADFARQIAEAIKHAEGSRVDAKEPFLAASRAVDGFFKAISDPLATLKNAVARKLTSYQTKVAEERRRAAEAEARRKREEEERARAAAAEAERQRLEAEAAAARARKPETEERAQEKAAVAEQQREESAVAAVVAGTEARQAEAIAAQSSTDLSRTRGQYGAVASLRKRWVHEVVNIDDVPRAYLKLDDAALREHIRVTKKGEVPAPIPGIRFVEEAQSVVR